jgi:glucosamine--fructose-6-phosphate aminotransferase (isomerizing)
MCGIVVVLRRRGEQGVGPRIATLGRRLEEALGSWPGSYGVLETARVGQDARRAAELLEGVDAELKRPGGVHALICDGDLRRRLETACAQLDERVIDVERLLDDPDATPVGELETASRDLLRLKDVLWALRHDRLGLAAAVESLARGRTEESVVGAYASIQTVLSALDRLEVRGRDSAGVSVVVWSHGLDLDASDTAALLERRRDPLFTNGAVRRFGPSLGFVYKAAAEVGQLGDNGAALRSAIRDDELLALAVRGPESQVVVLGHTRWASVGLINEANAHPLDEIEEPASSAPGPPVFAALNGDVDNYADLKAAHELAFPAEITTDAKVIPILVSRATAAGLQPLDAFRDTVSSFVGSVAIAAITPAAPERVLLALKGSGQALYVGLGADAFVVASEPYGLVEETASCLRLDGETPGNRSSPETSRGQIVALDWEQAGSIEGIGRWAYDGTPLPVRSSELQRLEITTRDVHRGEHPHFLRKEIGEAPTSFRKTLRGKVRGGDDELRVELPPESLPRSLLERLRADRLRRIVAIGQGTAAIAAAGMAALLRRELGDRLVVEAMPATELSGFGLVDDMHDSLVIAISQSGTTTDTNRTVDLVRSRGASVVSIVNRRHSDLTDRSDGVLYTSDGRDVEMSVASSKAFYSQIAAGTLLACALAQEVTGDDEGAVRRRTDLLAALRRLPAAMEEVLLREDSIAAVASRHAPNRRHWAVVGNGPNRVAAEEIRIKLSELCYKSIPCDATEDKKHIDLSSEPLVVVCAAGLQGSLADDVAKEVAIYRAHKAVPIVISSDGDQRFAAAVARITVPRVHPDLDFVLATVVGHLFGYHAALAIDDLARPLREMRGAIELLTHVGGDDTRRDLLEELGPALAEPSQAFFARLREGAYDGHLEASTAVDLASRLHFAVGDVPLDAYSAHHGAVGSPGVVIEDLAVVLTRAIDDLTRPIDAIKHQAKTVTVGISRTDEALFNVSLVRALLETGVDREHVGYGDLRTLAALDPVVEKVLGFTRYRVDGDPRSDDCAVRVVATGGVAREIPSRTTSRPLLRGTKRMVALERQLLAARGRNDGRTVILVPEVDGGRVVGLSLLHVRYRARASAAALRGVLGGYRRRYAALRDAIMETEPTFREDLLETVDVAALLCEPVHLLADRWRVSGGC